MNIEIVAVTENQKQSKAGKAYTELEVIYKDDSGKASTKKIMSFMNPAVFKAVQGAKGGDKIAVTTQKDDNGYWQWTGIGGNVTTTSAVAPATTPAAKVTSNYESKEERAVKQRYIVRQSSLSNAVDILSVGAKTLDKKAVLELASELEEWVFRVDTPKVGSIDEMEDDIPN
jgi:hypothetical protein